MSQPQRARSVTAVRWTPPNPYGELGRATCVRLPPNRWAVTGPLDEVGAIIEDACRFGKVDAEPAIPTRGDLVLVNFAVTPRPAQSAERRDQMFSPAAPRTGLMHALPAPKRGLAAVPCRAWWTAGAMLPVGLVVGVVWWLWVHMDAIAAGVGSALMTALGFLALVVGGRIALGVLGGGRSGTWKTD